MHGCKGGSDAGQDTCTPCTLGTSPDAAKENCVVNCGDGLKHATEECEDNNTADGDGCSSTCKLEDYSACIGGTTASFDACIK